MTLAPGTRIGPYEIVAPLGAGGMGEVWRARDMRLEREVAIKALPAAFARDAERLGRFEREAKLLASLNHANIAALYGLEELDGTPYLVLELVEGETLAQRLARGPAPVRETIELLAPIAAAIAAAHERGIVHRDLKPAQRHDRPVAARSRCSTSAWPAAARSRVRRRRRTSRVGDGRRTARRPGSSSARRRYMSPEQARGHVVDRRTDVWAFGCIALRVPGRHGPRSPAARPRT